MSCCQGLPGKLSMGSHWRALNANSLCDSVLGSAGARGGEVNRPCGHSKGCSEPVFLPLHRLAPWNPCFGFGISVMAQEGWVWEHDIAVSADLLGCGPGGDRGLPCPFL